MPRQSAKKSRQRALNAFDAAVDEEEYQVGLRQQEDIDPEFVADERIRQLVSGNVRPEDDEDIDSDEAFGSDSDISMNLNEASESEWGDSLDEEELIPLSEVWDQDSDGDKPSGNKKRVEYSPESGDVSESSSEGSEEEGEDSSSESNIESEMEGDSEEENYDALSKAVKSVAAGGDSSRRLAVHAGDENPFALPVSAEKVSIEELSGESGDKKKKAKPLSAPLPQTLQDREDRGAAFDIATGEISKWEDSVKQLRRAEHLQFPINAPPQLEERTPFTPSDDRNELESKVDSLLGQSQLQDEKGLSAFEQVAQSKLSFEELKKRRQELRYARELMFREEQRAKRIKKIKSKSWRKVHKKERLKQQEAVEEVESDQEDDGTKRAVERATLKHQSTKWGKERGAFGSESRQAMEEMLQQGDLLRQKVAGNDGSDSDSEFVLRDKPQELPDNGEQAPPQKGLLGMKFMVEAADREHKENERLLRDDYNENEEHESVGRRTFTPAGYKAAAEESDASDNDDAEASNSTSKQRLDNTRVANKSADSKKDIKSGATRDQKKGKGKEDQDQDNNGNQETPIDSGDNPWLSLSSTKGKSTYDSRPQKVVQKKPTVQIDVSNTLGDSLVREPELSLQQQDLVRQAFAGDDVTQEFERKKSETVEDEGDKEIDETLPGWGSWSGPDLRAPKKRKVQHVKGVSERKRRDFGLDGVIYNEKINKKNTRYQASAVPFPFENREQYERSLRMPIGQEWTSKGTFQRAIKPRVIVKRGEVIDPLEKPL